jgi:hypothetical protein
VRRLKPIGDFVHTITFDNGKEFAAHQEIAHALKAKIFFATPYHAWERSLNENTNGLIRDFFPKGTDFSTIANAEVAKVERLLNARPRKSLGFRSPQCTGNLNPRPNSDAFVHFCAPNCDFDKRLFYRRRTALSFRTAKTQNIHDPIHHFAHVTWRLLPPGLAGGINGSTSAHSSSVRSLVYRNALRS